MQRQEEGHWVALDNYFYLRVCVDEHGTCSGEVVRRETDAEGLATHIFDVPPQRNAHDLKDWAVRALEAYREG